MWRPGCRLEELDLPVARRVAERERVVEGTGLLLIARRADRDGTVLPQPAASRRAGPRTRPGRGPDPRTRRGESPRRPGRRRRTSPCCPARRGSAPSVRAAAARRRRSPPPRDSRTSTARTRRASARRAPGRPGRRRRSPRSRGSSRCRPRQLPRRDAERPARQHLRVADEAALRAERDQRPDLLTVRGLPARQADHQVLAAVAVQVVGLDGVSRRRRAEERGEHGERQPRQRVTERPDARSPEGHYPTVGATWPGSDIAARAVGKKKKDAVGVSERGERPR